MYWTPWCHTAGMGSGLSVEGGGLCGCSDAQAGLCAYNPPPLAAVSRRCVSRPAVPPLTAINLQSRRAGARTEDSQAGKPRLGHAARLCVSASSFPFSRCTSECALPLSIAAACWGSRPTIRPLRAAGITSPLAGVCLGRQTEAGGAECGVNPVRHGRLCASGSTQGVIAILEQGKAGVNQADRYGRTGMHFAAARGDIAMIQVRACPTVCIPQDAPSQLTLLASQRTKPVRGVPF